MAIHRETLLSQVIEYTCGQRCMDVPGNKGGCCTLGQRDFIIGPIRDVDAFLSRLSERLGREVQRAEVFIDFDEGRAMFPSRQCWQARKNYPSLRVLPEHPRVPCMFYDVDAGACTVYDIRPEVCSRYQCDHLRKLTNHI